MFGMTFAMGCKSAYYSTMETFGKHKRDILVGRVENARDAQESAKQQFQSALEKFTSVVNVPSSDLQVKYDQLKSELDSSESKANAVSKRIADVESVADDLFEEWQGEFNQYSNKDLRRASEQKYRQTQRRYDQLISAMKQAESKIEPVLAAFRDQVLFLKHNLNAQAIASLQNELVSIESDVAILIKEMDESIANANSFINSMAGGER
ncbi:MAG: DNA repair protein [Planctomycetes bacterium GWF2_50_10]|nr:MAG: DNA repair protein [Planctomycetes bacterium GWF2_50_10]